MAMPLHRTTIGRIQVFRPPFSHMSADLDVLWQGSVILQEILWAKFQNVGWATSGTFLLKNTRGLYWRRTSITRNGCWIQRIFLRRTGSVK